MEQILLPGEHIERIDSRLRLIVSPEHTFGTDALLLAAFAMPKQKDRACDLGTGCGIIPFFWLARGAQAVTGAEIQETAVSQARRSAALSELGERLTLVLTDVREKHAALPANGFDVVSVNPPYTQTGRGLVSRADAAKTARHETQLTLEDAAACAARLLKFGGRFCFCLPPERLPEAVCVCRAAGLEPKRLQLAAARQEKAPWLFLMECRKGGKPGMKVEPLLCVRGADGRYTPAMREILGEYGKD